MLNRELFSLRVFLFRSLTRSIFALFSPEASSVINKYSILLEEGLRKKASIRTSGEVMILVFRAFPSKRRSLLLFSFSFFPSPNNFFFPYLVSFMKVIIAGGGLGGLTSAIALKTTFKKNTEVVLLEARSIPEDKGAHIYLLEPAIEPLLRWMPEPHYLKKWLEDSNDSKDLPVHFVPLMNQGLVPPNIRRHTGVWETLHQTLVKAAIESGVEILNFHPVKEVEELEDGILVKVETEEKVIKEVKGDFLIGADGNSSVVRKNLLRILGEKKDCFSTYTGIYDLVANVPLKGIPLARSYIESFNGGEPSSSINLLTVPLQKDGISKTESSSLNGEEEEENQATRNLIMMLTPITNYEKSSSTNEGVGEVGVVLQASLSEEIANTFYGIHRREKSIEFYQTFVSQQDSNSSDSSKDQRKLSSILSEILTYLWENPTARCTYHKTKGLNFVPQKWHSKRIVLIGDAAHATPPFFGMGYTAAVGDIDSLIRCLAEKGIEESKDPEEAFKSYQKDRRDWGEGLWKRTLEAGMARFK